MTMEAVEQEVTEVVEQIEESLINEARIDGFATSGPHRFVDEHSMPVAQFVVTLAEPLEGTEITKFLVQVRGALVDFVMGAMHYESRVIAEGEWYTVTDADGDSVHWMEASEVGIVG